MHRFFKIVSFLLLLLAFFLGCTKRHPANWDVNGVLPVVTSQLSIQNFIGDSIFTADNTGLLSLNVTRTLTAIKFDSLITLPDTTIVQSYTIPAVFQSTLTPGQQLTFFPATELAFNISNGVALKRVDIREGVLHVRFSNSLAQPLEMLYIINDATKNGSPLTISESIPPGTYSLIKDYNLAGYSLSMRGLSGNLYNTIVQSCTISLSPNSSPAIVNYGQGATAEVTYHNIVPQYAEGYFGQQTITIPLDTSRLDLFKNVHATNFQLHSASLDFKILNSFGAEFTGGFSNIQSVNSFTNTVILLNNSQITHININRATQAGGIVSPSIKDIPFTPTNSNIVPFLSNLPDKLSYQGSVDVNPLGNISGYNDFAYYNQGIQVLADINIPMQFNADNFRLQSVAKVDFSNVSQLDHVRSGNFIVQVHNGYPFKVLLQAYLLDENQKVIDSLFVPKQNVIAGGHLDSQNKVVSPTYSKLLVPFDASKIQTLRRSKSIKVVTYLIMPPNPPDIKLYENYEIDVDVVADLIYNVVD